jgi:hypothetical protein
MQSLWRIMSNWRLLVGSVLSNRKRHSNALVLGSVTAAALAAGSVHSKHLAAGSVDSSALVIGSIHSNHLSVRSLSLDSLNTALSDSFPKTLADHAPGFIEGQRCQGGSGRVGVSCSGVLKELAPEVGLAPRRCEFLVKDSQLFRTNQAYSRLTQLNTPTTFPWQFP